MRIWYAVGFDSHEYMITSLPLHEADTAMHKSKPPLKWWFALPLKGAITGLTPQGVPKV